MKYNLDQYQQAAILSTSPNLIINASAGTGKTTTLIAATEYFLDTHNTDRVILLTFTNAAAVEMKSRLMANIYFVGTIHGFAYKELLTLAKRFRFRVRIMTRPQIITILTRLLHDYAIYEDSAIEECYAYIFDRTVLINVNTPLGATYRKIEQEYKDYKTKIGVYDYTDSPAYLKQKLLDYDQTLKFQAMFVDEAQDLNLEQYELIQNIQSPKKFIIGDPKQSIYLFRGANKEVFNKFASDGYEEHTLYNSYRSYQEILDFAGADLKSTLGVGGQIFKTAAEAMSVNPQILCRTNKEVFQITKYYSNATTIHQAKGAEFNNVLLVEFEPDGDEEDENVLFVALTRAKYGLGVFPMHEVLSAIKERKHHGL